MQAALNPQATGAQQTGLLAALTILTASMWWAWFAWDTTYQLNPVSGEVSGPYEVWQGIGCAICLIALAVVACMFLKPIAVIAVMPISFTLAYAFTVIPLDDSGLAVIGVLLMGFGSVAAVAAVVGVISAVRALASQ